MPKINLDPGFGDDKKIQDGFGSGSGYGSKSGEGFCAGDGIGNGSGHNAGSGHGDGSGSGYGAGDGAGDGSGSGTGYGDKDGSGHTMGTDKERKKIEFNILKNIPDIDLPLYIGIWEFNENENKFLKRISEIKLCQT